MISTDLGSLENLQVELEDSLLVKSVIHLSNIIPYGIIIMANL
jgi:hypothetical protein